MDPLALTFVRGHQYTPFRINLMIDKVNIRYLYVSGNHTDTVPESIRAYVNGRLRLPATRKALGGSSVEEPVVDGSFHCWLESPKTSPAVFLTMMGEQMDLSHVNDACQSISAALGREARVVHMNHVPTSVAQLQTISISQQVHTIVLRLRQKYTSNRIDVHTRRHPTRAFASSEPCWCSRYDTFSLAIHALSAALYRHAVAARDEAAIELLDKATARLSVQTTSSEVIDLLVASPTTPTDSTQADTSSIVDDDDLWQSFKGIHPHIDYLLSVPATSAEAEVTCPQDFVVRLPPQGCLRALFRLDHVSPHPGPSATVEDLARWLPVALSAVPLADCVVNRSFDFVGTYPFPVRVGSASSPGWYLGLMSFDRDLTIPGLPFIRLNILSDELRNTIESFLHVTFVLGPRLFGVIPQVANYDVFTASETLEAYFARLTEHSLKLARSTDTGMVLTADDVTRLEWSGLTKDCAAKHVRWLRDEHEGLRPSPTTIAELDVIAKHNLAPMECLVIDDPSDSSITAQIERLPDGPNDDEPTLFESMINLKTSREVLVVRVLHLRRPTVKRVMDAWLARSTDRLLPLHIVPRRQESKTLFDYMPYHVGRRESRSWDESAIAALFRDHSNIEAVMPGYRVNSGTVQRTAVVVVYVRIKGLCPVGEGRIPSIVCGRAVEVREGAVHHCGTPLATWRPEWWDQMNERFTLCPGVSAGRAAKTAAACLVGTIGSFVWSKKDGRMFGITNAHIAQESGRASAEQRRHAAAPASTDHSRAPAADCGGSAPSAAPAVVKVVDGAGAADSAALAADGAPVRGALESPGPSIRPPMLYLFNQRFGHIAPHHLPITAWCRGPYAGQDGASCESLGDSGGTIDAALLEVPESSWGAVTCTEDGSHVIYPGKRLVDDADDGKNRDSRENDDLTVVEMIHHDQISGGDLLVKIGRRTGFTWLTQMQLGYVKDVGGAACLPDGQQRLRRQLFYHSSVDMFETVCDDGDSGSLIFRYNADTLTISPVALLFAKLDRPSHPFFICATDLTCVLECFQQLGYPVSFTRP